MRSQILPRALCLITALLLCISPVCNAMKVFKAKTESTENKTVKAVNNDSYYFSIPVVDKKKNTSLKVSTRPDFTPATNNNILLEKMTNKELSFNYESEIGSKSIVKDENIISETADSQGFLKMGMFSGRHGHQCQKRVQFLQLIPHCHHRYCCHRLRQRERRQR